MKGFLFLLCALVAVQARSTGVREGGVDASLGENPWFVHLRLAVSTSGYLNTCAGSLIDSAWVLTSADCVRSSRFIWLRYGVVDVVRPSLVTETSATRISPDGLLALVSINRQVETTDTIAPVALATDDDELPGSAKFCGFGATDEGAPGEKLGCIQVNLSGDYDSIVAESADGQATQFDLGAPLVSDGVQYGVLVQPGDDIKSGFFLKVVHYRDWISEETGQRMRPGQVNFVN